MPYRIAGIDVHKRMLAVAVADVAVEGEYTFSRRRFGTRPSELRCLAEWLLSEEVEQVVLKALEKRPDRRPDAATFAAMFEKAAGR